jgi:hypothetical protein
MAVTPTVLIPAKFASTTMTAEYTAAGVVILDKLTATNVSGGSVSLTVHIVPPSGSVGNDNLVVQSTLIASGETRPIVGVMGHNLQSGAALWCQTSAANALVLYASGRDVA